MTPSLIPDPLQMWREAQLSTVSGGLQHAFEKAISAYLAKVNLPSRKDVSELAAALQRIEDKLDRLLPASAAMPALPRPARTRRPPPDEASAAPAKALAAAPAVGAPAKRTAARAGRRS
jgi:hypothetical protein